MSQEKTLLIVTILLSSALLVNVFHDYSQGVQINELRLKNELDNMKISSMIISNAMVDAKINCKQTDEIRLLKVKTDTAFYDESSIKEWRQTCDKVVEQYKKLYDSNKERIENFTKLIGEKID